MECATIQRWFSPYLDGLLAAPDRTTMEEHLANCVRCRRDLDSLKRMLASLRAMETAETPELLPGIRAKLTRLPWWETAASRFLAPWPASLPWHGLALAGSAALVAILVVIPEYRLKVKAPASESRQLQLSQVSSQARQYDAYRDADRADVPALSGGRMRAQSDVLDRISKEESAKAAGLSIQEASVPPLEVRWHTTDLAAAASQVCEWVRARQGGCSATDERHLTISLSSSEIPEFLQQFSSTPVRDQETDGVAPAAPAPAASLAPIQVVISLELVPSE